MSNDRWACLQLTLQNAMKELEAGKVIPAYKSLEQLHKLIHQMWEKELEENKVDI